MPNFAAPLTAWLDERPAWKNAAERALFLNRRGGRLTARGASDVFTAIGRTAGLNEATSACIGRHTFVTQLIRGGEDFVTVAELAGHSRLDTLRVYSQPTDEDKAAPLRTSPSTADDGQEYDDQEGDTRDRSTHRGRRPHPRWSDAGCLLPVDLQPAAGAYRYAPGRVRPRRADQPPPR
ncbi:hypothetical protein GCM10010191_88750 [Actinomadura vinacea]|uniref:Tyr recombinase domain-containing protein n=1 Tax=Actinomadura vinacea TaxID=115336 RepID=A0ABN3KCL9_9ACTN